MRSAFLLCSACFACGGPEFEGLASPGAEEYEVEVPTPELPPQARSGPSAVPVETACTPSREPELLLPGSLSVSLGGGGPCAVKRSETIRVRSASAQTLRLAFGSDLPNCAESDGALFCWEASTLTLSPCEAAEIKFSLTPEKHGPGEAQLTLTWCEDPACVAVFRLSASLPSRDTVGCGGPDV